MFLFRTPDSTIPELPEDIEDLPPSPPDGYTVPCETVYETRYELFCSFVDFLKVHLCFTN